MIERFPLTRHVDDRGWFGELVHASALPKPIRQANLSFSRRGVIRGLHYHERGQDDLFVCLEGMARVVVLDRESGETFTEDIGDANPVEAALPEEIALRPKDLFAHRLLFGPHAPSLS